MNNQKKKVLFTGAGGFLGRGICSEFDNENYDLTLVDVVDFDSKFKVVVGDVAKLDVCMKMLEGIDYLVIAHMFPRPYETPEGPFDANVKGTANLLYAAQKLGVKRTILISSGAACNGLEQNNSGAIDLRPCANELYSMTKACQEIVAESFHNEHNMEIVVLRVGCVVDLVNMVNKYNRTLEQKQAGMVDICDVSKAVKCAIIKDKVTYEIYHIYTYAKELHRKRVEFAEQNLGYSAEII